jgi:hypothetical protein
MDGLFSAGFAWDDGAVATDATPAATRPRARETGGAPTCRRGEPEKVANAATLPATGDIGIPTSVKVRKSNLNATSVASVASVAETEGQRLERLLSQPVVAVSATPVATAERADFCGVEGGAGSGVAPVASVADWLKGVEAMRRARPAPKPYHSPWRTILQDAASFVALWGDDAIRMGWSTLDVFGVNPDPSAARYDRLGLVVLLNGRPVQCLEDQVAHIGRDSRPTVFRRALRAEGAVPIWQWVRSVNGGKAGRGVQGLRADALTPVPPRLSTAMGGKR